MPESGQKPDNEEVTNHHVFLLGVRTAERFVYILTEPRSQTDVPARHELSDGTTHKGIAEVFREAETEHKSQTDCHVGICAEVVIELEHIAHRAEPGEEHGHRD